LWTDAQIAIQNPESDMSNSFFNSVLQLLGQAAKQLAAASSKAGPSPTLFVPVMIKVTKHRMLVLAFLSLGFMLSAQAQKTNSSAKATSKVNKKSSTGLGKSSSSSAANPATDTETAPNQSPASFSGAAVLQKRSQDQQDSVHSVVKQLLTHLTGPIGKKRDWEAVRKLFLQEANMVINGPKGVKVLPASTLWLNGDSLYGKIAFQEAESSFACQISGTIATVQQGYFCAVNNKPSHYGTNVYTLIKRPEGNWQINHLAWYQLPIK
jgi:hypothetical protein